MEQISLFYRLASNLAGEQCLKEQRQAICIITGSRGVGKTHFCQMLIQQLKSLGISFGGVISAARVEGEAKTGIFLEDLQSGERHLLGKDEPDEAYSYKVGCWYFNPGVLRWGNKCLEAAACRGVVIFDECGFLELEQGEGLQSGLKLFDARDFKLGIMVVRPSLLPIATKRWPEAIVYDLDKVLA